MNYKLCQKRRVRHPALSRRGSVIPMVALFLAAFVAMASFSIDVAYMQLVSTELRSATDAAAKAGTSALVQGQTDLQAKSAAAAMAAQNTVAGAPLKINASNMVIGQSQLQPDGSWKFIPNARPSQAMQITSNLNRSSSKGKVPLFFAPLLGVRTYSPSTTSVASAFACEVCLCLDRSGSMKWDLSGVNWMYPAPFFDNTKPYNMPPLPGSRWTALESSVNRFTSILSTANAPPRVGIVTWASDVSSDSDLSSSMSGVDSAVHGHTLENFQGGTNMSSGIEAARAMLTGTNSRTYAKKVMIVMSDGEWNEGSDPESLIENCIADNITVHTISLLVSGNGPVVLQHIAAQTGGKFYNATDAASLTAAWQDLAYSLPIVLTQ